MRALLAPLVLVPALALAQVPIQPLPPTSGEGEVPVRREPNRPAQATPPASPLPSPASPPAPGSTRPPVAPRPDAQRPAAPAPRPGTAPRVGGSQQATPPAAPAEGNAETIRANGKCVPLEGRFMLSFNKADIVDVLEQASRWTCRNFMYTDDVARGKITLLSKTPVTADEAYAAFLAALSANNVAVYPTGRYYKLHRLPDTKKNPIPTYVGDETIPATEQPVTKIIKLQYSDPDQLRGILGNFTSPQGADIQSIPPDTLVITDIGLNIRRIERLIDAIDRAGAGDLVRLVQIRFASAKDIADKVNQIFQAQGSGRTARRPVIAGTPGRPGQPGLPVPSSGGATEVSLSKVIPDERTNKLIVIADEKSFERVMELVDQLDVPTSGEGGIHVVFLKHANAEELAQTLSNLAQGQAKRSGTSAPGALPIPANLGMQQQRPPSQTAQQGEPTAELFAGDVKLTADKTQNALLVQAGGADFLAIQRLIARLDRPRRQVFVEAVILEVNLRDEDQFGVGAHGVVPFDYKGDKGIIPIASGNKDLWAAGNWLAHQTSRVVGEDVYAATLGGSGKFSTPEWEKAFGYIKELADHKCVNDSANAIDDNAGAQLFFQGKAAMHACAQCVDRAGELAADDEGQRRSPLVAAARDQPVAHRAGGAGLRGQLDRLARAEGLAQGSEVTQADHQAAISAVIGRKRTASPRTMGRPGGLSTRPSAQTAEVSTPELWLGNRSSPPSPLRRARRNSRRRSGRGQSKSARIGTGCGRAASMPCKARSNGDTATRKVTKLDTGLPGSPTNSAWPTLPKARGLPGLIATCHSSIRPSAATAGRIWSSSPTDTPPDVRIRSCVPAAPRRAARVASSWSGTMPRSVTSQPAASSRPRSV